MPKPSVDSNTRQRIERLKALEAEHLRNAGYAGDGPVPADIRERCHMAAVMKLAYEQLEARLLMGEVIDAGVMLKIAETITAILPPRGSLPLVVKFVAPHNDVECDTVEETWTPEEQRLQVEITRLTNERDHVRGEAEGLRAENYRLRQIAAPGEKGAVAPPAGQREASQERSSVVSLKPSIGSLVVDRPLEERYPLRHLDPVS